MKTLNLFIIIIMTSHFAFGQMDKVYAEIDGMGCAFCANGIERAFKDVKTKKSFKIDLEAGTMSFDIPATEGFEVDNLIDRIDRAGYSVRKISIQRAQGGEVSWSKPKSSKDGAETYTEEIITVFGNCGMCKTRIENAVNELDGVFFSFWNEETQKLHVRYNSSTLSIDDIELELASIGHDTERFKAADEVYNNLHGCCKYDRKQ
jgi:periplasmic mercuric ion binding protein